MSEGDAQVVFKLPRGGTIVLTKLGPVQFGIPPETIKDSMVLGLGIPSYYVVPTERFVKNFGPSQGVNVAEFEFPAYCNFFFKGRRVCLIVNSEDVKQRIQNVFQETLLGPREWDPDVDFDPNYPRERRPDLKKELGYFRKFGDSLIGVDMLLSFAVFDRKTNTVKLESGEDSVLIRRTATHYIVKDSDGKEIATVPTGVRIPRPKSNLISVSTKVFDPPLFGVTVLGSSHGFDPKGSTSGYVLWMNRRGIMIDPPPNSSTLLQENSIAPSLIDGVIVTHCHADHDAGTFQKILQEGKVTLMTTPTIHGSFVRKYAALAGLDEEFLKTVFDFRPCLIGEPVKCRGGVLKFFYSLHSIPCVGFEAFFGGRSIVFSADHMNDPDRVRKLCDEGVLSPGRRDALLEFPWHHDLILHEAGVPPIHTPMETLSALPEDVKQRLFVVHVALDKIPEGSGLRAAIPGVENTIVLENVEAPAHSKALDILDLVSSIPMFAEMTIKHASDVLSFSKVENFSAGDCIVRKGDIGTCFYAIMSGQAEVRVTKSPSSRSMLSTRSLKASQSEPELNGSGTGSGSEEMTVKTYFAGDYFGEQALISENSVRTADIYAMSDVKVLRFDRSDFKKLLQNTQIIERMAHLVQSRDSGSWDLIAQNSVLSKLSVTQKTQLETYIQKQETIQEGDYVWKKDDQAEWGVLVQEGNLKMTDSSTKLELSHQRSRSNEELPDEIECAQLGKLRNQFQTGSFLLNVDAIVDGGPVGFDLHATEDTTILYISREDLLSFFQTNPGVLLSLLHKRYVV